MGEVDTLLDKLAIEAALSVLAEEREVPGSQELVNLEAAREILGEQNFQLASSLFGKRETSGSCSITARFC